MADSAEQSHSWLHQRFLNARNRLQRRSILNEQDIEARFTKTYHLNYWGSVESRSGSGSTAEATQQIRRMLPEVIKQFGVRRLFDAPCGDFNWMQLLRPSLDVDYTGGDIVRPMIEHLSQTHADARTRFVHFDITRSDFPDVDLWLCRDCLFHLSYADARRALEGFARSSIPYVLMTTHLNDGQFVNRDISTGDYRSMDLFSAPYSLPRDVLFRFDDPTSARREMCLWSREQIVAALAAHSWPAAA